MDTILTSGQEADCLLGSKLIRHLIQVSADMLKMENISGKPTILVGGGVKSSNIAEIAKATGAYAFHLSGKSCVPEVCNIGMNGCIWDLKG